MAVARAEGVPVERAEVLAAGSNLVVRLRPAAVVARVYTGTRVLRDDVGLRLADEVAVGTFLGARGLAVSPAREVAPGPCQHDGCWMTFWRLVETEGSALAHGPEAVGRSLRELHEALAAFPGALAPLTAVRAAIERLLPGLERTEGALEALRALDETVFASPLPAQPLHGDAGIGNLLRTSAGLLWNDLEDVCSGPREWDVASLTISARRHGVDAAGVDALLDAYGRDDLADLAPFLRAHALYDTVWGEYAARRARGA